MVLAFLVVNAFMQAYECTTDTLLISFLLDEKYMKERKEGTYELKAPQFGMDVFMDNVEAHQKEGEGDEGEKEKLTTTDSSVEVEANP